ncbi:ArnT family glycosyltransferase [Methanoregula sp.]|uniref:ArnT family glycosyltransferase n=1 Tax=Methanoregula sp. TaxID=2052170 RepID=UPI003564DBB7
MSVIIMLFHIMKRNGYGKKITIPSISFTNTILILFLVINIILITLIAWISPPCNWDSMVSNVARIMHWIQNQNLNVFPTNIEAQFYYPPFASIAIMHLQLLSGTDYFSNFVQFFSMLGCLILVSLIAKRFSPSIECQIFSVIICGTIPMLILEASSTQYELVLGFFILCFIYFIDKFTNQPSFAYSFLAGASLGLAVYTKPVAYVYIIPFIVIFIVCMIKEFDFTNIKKSLMFWLTWTLLVPITFLTICLPYFYRNYEYFGNILGDSKGVVTIEFSFPKIITNFFWNLAEHLQFFYPINVGITTHINAIVSNIDTIFSVSPNSFREFMIPALNFSEDNTGNALHLILILLTLAILFIFTIRKKIKNMYMGLYIFGIGFSFILFCMFFNYNVYNIRYQLPLFMITAPLVGYVLSNHFNKKIAYLILIIVLIMSVPWVVLNETKPIISYKSLEPTYPTISKIIGKNISEIIDRNPPEFTQSIFERDRNAQYFNTNRNAKEPFFVLTQYIKEQKYENIGFDIIFNSPYNNEYQLWMLLKNDSGSFPRIEHVNVDNPSKYFQDNSLKDFKPDVIFSAKKGNDEIQIGENVSIDNNTYKKIKGYGNYSLLIPV